MWMKMREKNQRHINHWPNREWGTIYREEGEGGKTHLKYGETTARLRKLGLLLALHPGY